jgi:Ser/Thr protein kinase RdoA (MazF antagonist)
MAKHHLVPHVVSCHVCASDIFRLYDSGMKTKHKETKMDGRLSQILALYGMTVKTIEKLNMDKDVFKATDDDGKSYFLKVFKKHGGDDMEPCDNVYHTHEQIQLEMEILHLLSNGVLHTAIPIKNKMDEWVTVLTPDTKDESPEYAAMTSFIEAESMENSQTPMTKMAYFAGVSAAQLHLESEKRLLQIAVKRPHKRQGYMLKMKNRLVHGVATGALSASQFNMLNLCVDVVMNCMNRLDEDPAYDIGLVHTDIRSENCMYVPDKVIPIDFSRSVYSYYLYDVAEMCAHIGGSDVKNAILRGYQSVKPLKKGHIFMIQAFMSMFLMMVIAETVDEVHNSWRTGLLETFKNEIQPGLSSGKGFFDSLALKGINE